ncbi:hypothetical protein SESBI_14163 [Sesbania bispinosa]|nr:hypothetical protein SESBI_14163 [Sesbania bispinosa]
MIPMEIMEPTIRASTHDDVDNNSEHRVDLDLLAEVREVAHLREFACKQRAERKYNLRMVLRKLRVGDLVLRKTIKDGSSNKFTPNWDGPFRIREDIGRGAYRLEELNGREIPRTRNLINLRAYYS